MEFQFSLKFNPELYLVVDADYCFPHSAEAVVAQAIEGGVTLVQLRSKTASTRDFISLAEKIKRITDQNLIPFIINDRVDLVLAVKVSGVHLGQSDMSVENARNILGENALIGLSANTYIQALQALELPIDYLGVGPLFKTETKREAKVNLNFNDLKKLCQLSSKPVVGIGGIHSKNLNLILGTGLAGIAVVSAICSSADPKKAALELKNGFKAL